MEVTVAGETTSDCYIHPLSANGGCNKRSDDKQMSLVQIRQQQHSSGYKGKKRGLLQLLLYLLYQSQQFCLDIVQVVSL
jgi:hypothetical protein